MGVASRRIAWTHDQRAGGSKTLGLAALETVYILAWTLVVTALLRLLVGYYLYLLPPVYLLAAGLAAMLETSGDGRRLNPMTALGLSTFRASDGSSPGSERQFLRLLVTPPLLLILGAGFLPMLWNRRSVPEMLSGVRVFEIEADIDPRPMRAIRTERKHSVISVVSTALLSLGVALLVLLTTPDHPIRLIRAGVSDTPGPAAELLSGEEQALLAEYLTLSAQYPDSLAFHVRLASLYYRNDMTVDFVRELEEIRRLDPEHPLLLLEEEVRLEEIFTSADTAATMMWQPGHPPLSVTTTSPDSSAADSTEALRDSVMVDSLVLLLPDSIPPPPLTLHSTIGAPVDTADIETPEPLSDSTSSSVSDTSDIRETPSPDQSAGGQPSPPEETEPSDSTPDGE